MKNVILVLLLLSIGSLMALDAPGNLRATAVTDDAFTLRWEAVTDADQYEIEVKEILVYEGFDADEFPDTWGASNILLQTSYLFLSPYEKDNFVVMKSYVSTLTTPLVHNAKAVDFWAYYNSTTSYVDVTLTIQYASDLDNPSWQTIGTLGYSDLKKPARYHTVPLNLEGAYYIRFMLNAPANGFFIDEISVTGTAISAQPSYPAHRVDGLSPDTQYKYRVRSKNTTTGVTSDFSNWVTQSTPAEAAAPATGSVIDGGSVTIDLPASGSGTHSIQIDPVLNDADYSIEFGETDASRSYTITCEDNSAFAGTYTINHPGFRASDIHAIGAELADYPVLDDGSSGFEIVSYSGKGSLQIVLIRDDTLPVEFGTMYVTTYGDLVMLQWFSHSESGLQGYYVLRGPSKDLSTAAYASDLIPAYNVSSTSQYHFRDFVTGGSYYYWVEALDFSGHQEYFGPLCYEAPEPDPDTPSIPMQNSLSAFPNPFNSCTTISYQLAAKALVSLDIYDIRGRLVHSHQKETKDAGQYSQVWDAGKLPSGVYLVRMKMGEEILRMKAMVVK